MQIQWRGFQPPASWVMQCSEAIESLELDRPADLMFHDEWLVGEPGDKRHITASIWGEPGVDHLWAELHFNPEYVSLNEERGE